MKKTEGEVFKTLITEKQLIAVYLKEKQLIREILTKISAKGLPY